MVELLTVGKERPRGPFLSPCSVTVAQLGLAQVECMLLWALFVRMCSCLLCPEDGFLAVIQHLRLLQQTVLAIRTKFSSR